MKMTKEELEMWIARHAGRCGLCGKRSLSGHDPAAMSTADNPVLPVCQNCLAGLAPDFKAYWVGR